MTSSTKNVSMNHVQIHAVQCNDTELQAVQKHSKKGISMRQNGTGLQSYHIDSKWRLFVPKKTRLDFMICYNEALIHPGIQRIKESAQHYFMWLECTRHIAKFVKQCDICQTNKGKNNSRSGICWIYCQLN